MKKRLLSLVLAASMVLGSMNVAFADDTSISTETAVTESVDDEAVSVADVVESGDSTEEPDTDQTTGGPDWATTDPWKATVFGDCGGQARIDNYGNLSSTDSYPNGDGVYIYNVTENGSEVNVRMGIPDYNDPTNSSSPVQPQGKIAGSSEGIVYYYQQITADEDYTLSATAHVNGILNTNSQVSFGATVRDTVVPLDGTNSKLVGDSISAAVLDMDKTGSTEAGKALRFAYYRQGGTLTKFDSAKTAAPTIGDDIEVSITKAGSMYTLQFGDETTTVNADEAGLSFTDDVYVGFFASRCADITFSNVTYKKSGTVEVGEWALGGNGLFATDASKLNSVTLTTANDNADIDLVLKATSPTGKVLSSEQSYAYYASQNPAGEDFELNATIDSIDFMPQYDGGTFKNQNQAFVGAVVFNNTYGDPRTGNQVFVGLMSDKSASTDADLVAITYDSSNTASPYNKTTIASGVVNVGETLNGPIDFKLKRSGDVIKVTWGTYTADIDVTGILTDNQYIGYAVARDGGISVKNNSLVVGTRKVASVEIATMPEKTEYYATQKFDTTGLSFNVTYEDGGSEIISDSENYSLLGFDDTANQSFNTIGEKVVQASVGGVTVDIPITVRAMKVTSISVDYTPSYDTFYVGGKVNVTGMQITATFEDGTSKKLSSSEYKLYLGDTEIVPGVTTITEDMASADTAITVRYTDADETIDSTTAEGSFYVNINPGKLQSLAIKTTPYRTIFYVGEELDTSGLVVSGVYVNGTTESRQVISSDLYEVVGFSSDAVTDKLTLTIQYKEDPSIKTTYNIQVKESTPLRKEYEGYPRLTYSVNEAFDASGLVMGVNYTNGTTVNFSSDVYYYKDGDSYYKVYANNEYDADGNIIYSKGDKVVFTKETMSEFTNADFYVDLTDYDNTTVGTTSISIYVNSKYGIAAEEPEVWNVTIAEAKDYVWKATIFGASSLGVNDGDPASKITANYTNGDSAITTKGDSSIAAMLMENGKVNGLDSIQLSTWDKSGKITGSQDGIAYFYTKVNADENFVLSGDVTVNRYIADPNNLTSSQKELYDSYIAAGDSPDVALDKLREGQEGFGIIARDVIPLAGTMKDGAYTGNTNGITELASDAMTKEYTFTKSDGSTVTYVAPVDALEAQNNNMAVVDEKGVSRLPKANADAASNAVFAGGLSNGTWPKDPSSSTYNKYTQVNRINLTVRYDGSKIGYYTTTTKLPESGEKYNIQLSMTNTGYKLTTYNYQTDTTATQYFYDNVEETSNVLKTKDPDNFYVGFYAARWADITVSNVEFHQTNTTTEQNKNGSTDESIAPKISISSPLYTTNAKYTLVMKTNSDKYDPDGLASISLNGKNIFSDVVIGGKSRTYDTTLKENSVNNFSVVYYPNTADTNLSSYDPVITRFTVTHKSRNEVNDLKKIYVAPNGTLSGDGTRNNPLTLEAAVNLVESGGEVIMLDGTYNLTNEYDGKLSIGESLAAMKGKPKSLVADEGASPVIDLAKEYAGFEVAADYWHFKGFSVINSKDNSNGFVIGGNHCIVENCTFSGNGDTGMQISRVGSSNDYIYYWPAYNVIKSCESYNNNDPSQNNADGFAAKLTVGYGNVFQDCISHHNVDDGWDLYTKIETGAIGPVVLENCITYKNGYRLYESTGTDELWGPKIEGNGFKLGGESIYVEHMLKDCVSFENYNAGVTTNNNPAMKMRNVIAYNNVGTNIYLKTGSTEILTDANDKQEDSNNRPYKFNYDLKGVVSYGSNDSIGSWNSDTDFGNISTTPIESESNYLAKTGTVGVNSEGVAVDPSTFFVSTDKTDSMGSNMRYSRNADGSFDHGDFLARVIPYVHDAADLVTLPDMNGGQGGVGLSTTEATTTEETTRRTSSGGGGGGAGGKLKVNKYETTTVASEESTEVTSEDSTEETTSVAFTDSVSVQVGSTDITINESKYSMDVAPYIQATSNSTMVPLRFVSIALAGGNVSDADSSNLIVWDAASKTATITAGSNTIVFTAGAGTYMVNGATLNISNQAVAEIVDGRMFVPFRTIGEALGADVSWDADTKTAMYN